MTDPRHDGSVSPGHRSGSPRPGRTGWLLVAAGCVLAFVVGGVFAASRGGDDGETTEAAGETSTPGDEPSTTTEPAAPTSDQPVTSEPDTATTSTDTAAPDRSTTTTAAGPPPIGAVLDDGRPASFWAITDETYELVRVDTTTGEILDRNGGWGDISGCDPDDGCYPQAIDDVHLSSDGTLYIADCCEPAVGNIYAIEGGDTLDTSNDLWSYGLVPIPSPNGRAVATSQLGTVGVAAADDPNTLVILGDQGFGGGSGFWHLPVAWLDNTTLVVLTNEVAVEVPSGEAAVALLDVSDRSALSLGPALYQGDISDVDVRADGNLLVILDEGGNRIGRAIDVQTGETLGEFDLPDDVDRIDYDASRTYLITVATDGTVRWYGAGSSGELGTGFVAVTW